MGTAGLFVLLHAEFLAAVQVLLYAGGVVTIVVFAIMLTERLVGDSLRQTNRGIVAGAAAAAAVFVGLAGHHPARGAPASRAGCAGAHDGAPRPRGAHASGCSPSRCWAILLVAALLGALYLARTEE